MTTLILCFMFGGIAGEPWSFAVPLAEFTVGTAETRYTEATMAEAIRRNVPLVVYVNLPEQREPGAMTCMTHEYDGDKTARVVRLFPSGGKLWERLPDMSGGVARHLLRFPVFRGGGC